MEKPEAPITCNINHTLYSGSDTIPVRSILEVTKKVKQLALPSCTFGIYKHE